MKNDIVLLGTTLGLFLNFIFPFSARSEKVPEWVIAPYTKQGYPKTFKKFKGRIDELNTYRIKAANKAASDRECKNVVAAEISSSATYNNMLFFVDCQTSSGGFKRFKFTESQLNNSNSYLLSESDKAYTQSEATKLCEGLIKRNANYPSTVGVNLYSVGYRKFETLGNVHVTMNFKAKNAFGLTLKYKAKCIFKPGDPNGEITISERQ